MGISIREYAKRIGRHHSTVQEAIATGFEDFVQLDLESTDILLPLMKAIIKHENGQQPYTDQQILEGIKC